ncbi:MAG: Hsp20/alpha crystallin family protein [Flavobacteriales bacterium]|nr:Hsp20/alpha crystallin family protein [Flavobacteriales bacterium]MCB9193659.1 Hsp20/alpha crystallin family protein [Flavobacteriales bacterium]
MTIVKYRPQDRLMSPFNELVNEFFGRDLSQFLGSDDTRNTLPSVNIVERNKDYKLDLLAPGFGKKDLKVNVENNVLTISAEKKVEDLKENERFTRREFAHRSFTRSFRLPEGVEHEHIKAEYNDGVLSLMIPKVEEVKPATKEISIQ